MRATPTLVAAALLYAAGAALASPAAFAGGWTAEARAEIEALRSGTLEKLVVHEDPRPAVDATFDDRHGAQRLFSEDYAGRVVLANLWATWCPPCRKEMPSIDRLKAALESDDIAVVAVATNERRGVESIADFYAEENITSLEILIDPNQKLARAMGALGLPITVILDREGREIARLQGEAEWDSESAKAILARVAELTAPES